MIGRRDLLRLTESYMNVTTAGGSAVNDRCTHEEIREVLLQTSVYCGAPAALESFRVAERVLSEISADG